jgi:dTDP-4-amino-4,6-dideoxygalactose transaminase
LRPAFLEATNRVLNSNGFILGPELERFESEWADYCEARYAIGVGNGLDALHLALRAVGVGPGDEVIVPANTFIATWLAVTMCGATPVGVEVDSASFNISPSSVRAGLTDRTKAIVAVHLYGQPAQIDELLAICDEFGLDLVEDAAQAHGARYKEKRIGAHGSVVAWSFYPGKNLGALGDAGAVTTNNPRIAEAVKLLRNYGSGKKYFHEIQGVNSRLDELQAAFLSEKLPQLDAWNARRQLIAAAYTDALTPLLGRSPGKDKPALLAVPFVPDWADPVWHLYVIRANHRDWLATFLSENGVETSVHYPVPPAGQPAYNDRLGIESTPFSQASAAELLSLPIGPHLSDSQVKIVIQLLREFFSA